MSVWILAPIQSNKCFIGAQQMNSRVLSALLLVGLFAVVQHVGALQNSVINFGISLSLSPTGTLRQTQSLSVWEGLQLWLDKANTRGGSVIRNATYTYNITKYEDDGVLDKVVPLYQQMLNDSSIDYLMGPINSDFTIPLLAYTEPAKRMLVATSAGSDSFYRGNDFAFSVVQPSSRFIFTAFPYLRLHKVQDIVTITSPHPFHSGACNGITDKTARENGFEPPTRYTIDSNLDGVTDQTLAAFRNYTSIFLETQPEVVVACMWSDSSEALLRAFKEANFSPKLILFVPLGLDYGDIDTSVADFVTGTESFDPRANFPSDAFFGSTRQFVQDYEERFGHEPDEYSAFGALTGLLYQLAIERAASFSQEDVRDSMQRLNVDTFMGQMFFGTDHSNQLPTVFKQYIHADRFIIGPPIAQSDNIELVYPFPTWDERVFISEWNQSPQEWAMFGLLLFGDALAISLLILTIVKRNQPIMRASSPLFMAIILIGALFLYNSILVWPLNNLSAPVCHLQIWMLSFGFTLMFGGLFAKSWRVYKLSSNRSLKVFKITDSTLIGIVGVLLAGDALICALATGLVDMTPVRVVVDEFRPAHDYELCPTPPTLVGLTAAIIAYNGLIAVAGLVIAYKIRKLKYVVFNESRIIAFSMYNVCIFAVVIVVLQYADANDRYVLYMVRSLGIFLATSITVLTLYVSKFMIWNKNPRLTSNSNMSTKLSGSSDLKVKSNQSADESGNEWKARYEQATAEIKQLRAQIAELTATPTIKSVQPEPPTPATMDSNKPLQDKSESSSNRSSSSEQSSSSTSSSSEDSSESS